jgi:rRNA maturation endonuclease Nob1
MITVFNKAQSQANLVCVAGCGSFRARPGTKCPACGGDSKPQAPASDVKGFGPGGVGDGESQVD